MYSPVSAKRLRFNSLTFSSASRSLESRLQQEIWAVDYLAKVVEGISWCCADELTPSPHRAMLQEER